MLLRVGFAHAQVSGATEEELSFLRGYLTFTSVAHTGASEKDSLLRPDGLFPAGLSDMVVRALRDRGTAVQRIQRPSPGAFVPSPDLSHCWPHQREAIQLVLDGRHRGIIQHATGTGKSVTISTICRITTDRVLVIVPSKQLLKEMHARLAQYGIKAGRIGAGFRDLKPRVVVCIAASLKVLNKAQLEAFGVVLVDECFPAGTMVGNVPIERIREGDLVPSYDEKSGTFVTRRVKKVFVTPVGDMVRLHFSDGRKIVCTVGHPFLTEAGWKPAIALQGRSVASSPYDTGQRNVSNLQRAFPSVEGSDELDSARKEGLLLPEVPTAYGNVSGNQGHAFRANESQEPDAAPGQYRRDGECSPISGALGASRARGKWERHDCSANEAPGGPGTGVDIRICSEPGTRRERASHALQDRSGPFGPEDCRRSRRRDSQDEGGQGAGRPEGSQAFWARVDRVEILEPGSPEERERLCPGGVVYNLHVEGTETYLVDGLVAHNCHGTPSVSILEPVMRMKNAWLRLGFSGTPMDRADKKSLYIVGVLGEVFHRFSPKKAEKEGIVARCILRMVPCEHPAHKTSRRYDRWEARAYAHNQKRNLLIARLVSSSQAPRIVFVRTKEHQSVLSKLLGVDCLTVNDETPTEEVQKIIAAFKSGAVGTLLSTPIFRQGIDIPEIQTVINGAGGKACIDVIQKVGRGSRRFQADGSTKDSFRVYDIDDRGCGRCGGNHKSCEWLERHSFERAESYKRFGYTVLPPE